MDLADELGVSDRTLRRDIDRLRGLGYSIDADRGTDGGYRLGSSPDGTLLTLSLGLTGPLARVGWLMSGSLSKRYVRTEADSIARAAESR